MGIEGAKSSRGMARLQIVRPLSQEDAELSGSPAGGREDVGLGRRGSSRLAVSVFSVRYQREMGVGGGLQRVRVEGPG